MLAPAPAACDPRPEGGARPDGPPEAPADSAAEPCGTDRPSIEALSAGPWHDEESPGLVLSMMASDPDEALHFMTVRVWYDLEIDGAVYLEDEPTWTMALDAPDADGWDSYRARASTCTSTADGEDVCP